MVVNRKRFEHFTLRRTPFWLFFLAGISLATLAPLFNDPIITFIGIALSVLVMGSTAAARLRDMGCSAWYTPLAVIPLVAFYTGATAGDDLPGHPPQVELRLITTSFFSALLSLSWATSVLAY